jgi:KUP system potassium uptake protein
MMNKRTSLDIPGNTKVTSLTLGAIGVVFGDIGTSPIYALKETFHKSGSELADIYGVVSLVFWALMLVVTIKYLTFVMRADNNGEGGILALFALMPESFRNPTNYRKKTLFILVLVGTALLFGDGVLTPAISVLSATEGLAQVNEAFSSAAVPLTVLILGVLFAVQSRGTHAIGKLFGPVMVAWFGFIGTLGIYQFSKRPEVIKALSPTYAIEYFSNHGLSSFVLLSSVILAVTGAEALYADMGHFGAKPIRIGWVTIVGPALVFCYLGQASLVAQNEINAQNPFFSLAPNKTWTLILVLMATAATVIASQALITGVFSLSRQAVQLGLFPRLTIRHTSHEHEGQIYVPLTNWILGALSILLVLAFQSSSSLAHAYVLAIAGTMFITTLAFHRVASDVWKWSKLKIYPLTLMFFIIDLAFLAGTIANIFQGGWVPILIGAFVLGVILVWRAGYKALNTFMRTHQQDWDSLISEISHGSITRSPGIGVFLASPSELVPAALTSQAKIMHSIPAEILVVTVITDPVPYAEKSVEIVDIYDRIKKVTIHSGYMESVDLPKTISQNVLGDHERAATYYLSERKFHGTDEGLVRASTEKLFGILHRNAATPSSYFGLPSDRIITLGTRIDL